MKADTGNAVSKKVKYMNYGDLPSRYLVEKGKELIIEKYSKKTTDTYIK